VRETEITVAPLSTRGAHAAARGALAQHDHRFTGRDAHSMLGMAYGSEGFDDVGLLQGQPRRQDVDVLRLQLDVLAERAFDLAARRAPLRGTGCRLREALVAPLPQAMMGLMMTC